MALEPNPDTPPDSDDPTGICSRCGRQSGFQSAGEPLPVTLDRSVRPANVSERVISLFCLGCHQATVVVEQKWVGSVKAEPGNHRLSGQVSYRGVHWYPPPGAGDLDASIPESIRGTFAEGQRALAASAPRAAVVMLRVGLEAIVTESGSDNARATLKDKNLFQALEVMADERALDGSLGEWAAAIRKTGNAGGHFNADDVVSVGDAEDLSHLMRELMRYLYEMPARVQRARRK